MRYQVRSQSLRDSPPQSFDFGSSELRFHTNDPYSHDWFLPRYRDGAWHEASASKLWIEACRDAAVVVDVGANLGWFSCLAAMANPKTRVYAFEPAASNLKLAKANAELNALHQIDWKSVIVGDGKTKVSWVEGAPGLPHASNRAQVSGEQFETMALDDFFRSRPKPDVVKIDVEGTEDLVLHGMDSLLQDKTLRAVLMEIHPAWLAERNIKARTLAERLIDAGFQLSIVPNLPEADLVRYCPEALEAAANGEVKIWAVRA